MRVDVHQHIWTPHLAEALANRTSPPFVEREGGLTVLHCAGARPYVIDLESEAPVARARLVREDGLDLAVIAISSPIGIETLPRSSARELIGAYLDGVQRLPAEFAAWGPLALDQVGADDVDEVLERGCVGVSVPAAALARPGLLVALDEVLARIATHEVPLFVHPGLATAHSDAWAALHRPEWWPALTDYVWQMQAAWLTFTSVGRRRHPDLAVVFSMLAGCAPLLTDRLRARGGPAVDLRDPRVFYETSSYGRTAIAAMAEAVGESQVVYGSDRPVIEPVASGRDEALEAKAAALFSRLRASV